MANIRMKKGDADKWLTALRSGEFTQGKNYLHHKGKYCCLGVMEMVISGEVEGKNAIAMPTLEWLKAHGITFNEDTLVGNTNPIMLNTDLTVRGSIATLNDEGGLSFPEIADLIEQNLETY